MKSLRRLSLAEQTAAHPRERLVSGHWGGLGYDLRRIVRHVGESPADAGVVVAGSCEVLAWFATQAVPVSELSKRPQFKFDTEQVRFPRPTPATGSGWVE